MEYPILDTLKRPRLIYTGNDIERARQDSATITAAVEAAERACAKERTESYAEYFVTLPHPSLPLRHEGDDWPYWSGLAGELRGDLQALAWAYLVTGQQKFLERCMVTLGAVAGWERWYDVDYLPGKAPLLDTFALTVGMAAVYDWLHAFLPPDLRQTTREALVKKGVEFIYRFATDNRHGATPLDNPCVDPGQWPNGYAMVDAALGMGSLALLGEEEDAVRWLDVAVDKARLLLDKECGTDGGMVEGLGYASATIDPLIQFLVSLKQTLGVDLLYHPYFAVHIR